MPISISGRPPGQIKKEYNELDNETVIQLEDVGKERKLNLEKKEKYTLCKCSKHGQIECLQFGGLKRSFLLGGMSVSL